MAVLSQIISPAAATPSFHSDRFRHRNPRQNNYFPITTASSSPAPATITLKAYSHNSRRNNSDRYKPPISFPVLLVLKKNLLKATLYGAAANLVLLLLQGGGGGSNNAGSIVRGGGGGGAGKSGNFLSRLFSVQGIDKDEKSESESQFYRVGSPVYMLGRFKKYTVSDVLFFDRRLGAFTDPTEDPLFRLVSILPGQVYTRSQLQKELENLSGSGLFEEIDIDCKRNRDGSLRLRISFLERTWPGPAERIRCINVGLIPNWNPTIEIIPNKKRLEHIKNATEDEYSKRMETARPCLIPMAVEEEISDKLRKRKEENGGGITARALVKVREKVRKWYSDNGYACAQVVSFGKLNSDELVCEVAEGNITGVQVVGDCAAAVAVERVLPYRLRTGEVFNAEVAEQAKLSIDSLGPFSNTVIDLELDEENGGGVVVKFKVEKKREDDSLVECDE